MMIITDIRKRKGKLFALFSYDEEIAQLDSAVVQENGIRAGTEITDEELEELVLISQEKRAKEKALWLLSYRDHSGKELEQKLRRTSDPDAAAAAVETMKEYGLVNDEAFAQRRAEYLIYTKGYSTSRTEYELIQKGIDTETVRDIILSMNVDERERLAEIVERRFLPVPEDEKGKRRIFNALQRLGYSYGDIKSVVAEYTCMTEDD